MPQKIRTVIGDGISLNATTTQKFKTSFLSVNFLGPLSKKLCSERTLALSVLKRASGRYQKAIDIGRELQSLYGARLSLMIRKKGDYHCAGLAVEFLEDRYLLNGEKQLHRAIDFLKELLLNPLVKDGGFDSAVTQNEKKNLADRIAARIDDKISYAQLRCNEIMCAGEAFENYEFGDIDAVNSITEKELYDAYQRMLKDAVIEIVYVGECDGEELAKSLRSAFKIEGRKPLPLPATLVTQAGESIKEVSEEMPVVQGKLSLGFRTEVTASSDIFPSLFVMNAVFGATPTSKLFANVRERLSLCYYCSSRIDMIKGLMLVNAGIENKNKDITKDEVLRQFELVKKGEITDEELFEAKITMVNALRSAADSAAAIEDFQLSAFLSGANFDHESLAAQIETVTASDVVAAADTLKLDTVYFLKGEEQ